MNEELLLQQAFEAQEDIRAKLEEAKKKKANVKTTDLVSINRYTGERTYRAPQSRLYIKRPRTTPTKKYRDTKIN